MKFRIEKESGYARAGVLETNSSIIKTPVFMPVGTQASVKSLDSFDLMNTLDAKIILGNTYHLYLRPSPKIVKHLGGLRKFTGFNRSFLTDSGGFQAFSLNSNTKNSDEGIEFKSHIDGSRHLFTPQKVLDIQYDLGSDIMMILDDLIALPATKERLTTSINRTTKWAKESLIHHINSKEKGIGLNQNIFAIIQGGTDLDFRKLSVNQLVELEYKNQKFDGYAIGGLSVGESKNEMYDTVEYLKEFMPKEKPRYLMGVGTPENLVENVYRGVDMFDCVMPSRNARNATLFTNYGKINIKSAKFKLSDEAIDEECGCPTCQNYSKGYINHLYRAKELSYFRLATLHNLYYYLDLMKNIRKSILEERFDKFRKNFYEKRR